MKIKVKYSLNREIDSYLNSLYRFRWFKHGRSDIQERLLKPFPDDFKNSLKRAKNEAEARKVIKKFRLENIKKTRESYSRVAKILEERWGKEGDSIIKKLEDIYGKKLPFPELTVYLQSIPICPYNYKEKWIMMFANTDVSQQLRIIIHELNHFMFYYHFPNLKEELGKEKYEILKEALAIYSNPEGNDKPSVKKLETYFKKHLDKSIPEVLSLGEWKDYL